MAGSSFLRERSPVTPNRTSTLGPATRGSLLSRGSLSGFPSIPISSAGEGIARTFLQPATATALEVSGWCAQNQALVTLGEVRSRPGPIDSVFQNIEQLREPFGPIP